MKKQQLKRAIERAIMQVMETRFPNIPFESADVPDCVTLTIEGNYVRECTDAMSESHDRGEVCFEGNDNTTIWTIYTH